MLNLSNVSSDTFSSYAKTLNKFNEHDIFSEAGYEGILISCMVNYQSLNYIIINLTPCIIK